MSGDILIIGGGTVSYSFAKEYIKHHKPGCVACADSGLDTAKKLGLSVDFLLGDFDSVKKETLGSFIEESLKDGSTRFEKYPPEKDYTDMHLILEWAVSQKPSGIVILGATGGRLDHLVANINMLMLPLENNIPAYIIDKNNKLCLVNGRYKDNRRSNSIVTNSSFTNSSFTNSNLTIGKITIKNKNNNYWKYISVYPLTEEVTGLNLSGVKYPLNNATVKKGTSMTISNEFAENAEEAVISLDKGILIVIQSRD